MRHRRQTKIAKRTLPKEPHTHTLAHATAFDGLNCQPGGIGVIWFSPGSIDEASITMKNIRPPTPIEAARRVGLTCCL